MFCVLFLVLLVTSIEGAEIGEPCIVRGILGVCESADVCQHAIENATTASDASSSNGSEAVVCCYESLTTNQENHCQPIPEFRTGKKTGQKAWDKCLEYQNLVYPCVDGTREDRCQHSQVEHLLPTSSTHTRRHEFPYLVLLGYTNDLKQLDWLCAGALLSEKFVLTAAHCVSSRNVGPVTHIALNPPDRADIEPETIHRIKSVIRHPEFRAPLVYHDIALLELEEQIPLNPRTVPVCLVGGDPESETATATTWNTHDVLNTHITWLRKSTLTRYPAAECSSLFPQSRRGGYNDTTQTCYGDKTQAKDMCQDDGGAALVMQLRVPSCMYGVVGIASYGRGCYTHSPGVYTRVLPYVGWIESVLWPQEDMLARKV